MQIAGITFRPIVPSYTTNLIDQFIKCSPPLSTDDHSMNSSGISDVVSIMQTQGHIFA